MAILFEETFGTLAVGTAITTGNTVYDLISGSGTVTAVTDGVRSSAGRFAVAATLTTSSARSPLGSLRGEFYSRFYLRISTLPAAGTGIQIMTARSATTARADIRLNSAGAIAIRDQGVQVAISTPVLALSQWHRVEWHWNQTGNAQELRVWTGSNRDSVGTADIILTGTAGGGTADNVNRGILTGSTNLSLDIDDDRIDDTTWIGPSTAPAPAEVGTLWDETFGTLAAGTALTTSNTSYDLISLITGATATAVTDGVRSSAGRFAVAGTAGNAHARRTLTTPETVMYWRLYIRFAALPGTATAIAVVRSGTTHLGELRITTAGNVQLRDQGGTIVASSNAALALNAWHRVEWWWNQANGLQEARLWLSPNLHSSGAQDETVSGILTVVTTPDNTARGVVTTATNWSVDIDDDKGSDTTWPGPSVIGVPAALLSEGFEVGAQGTNLSTTNTGFDAVVKVGTATATFDSVNFSSGVRSAKLACPAVADNVQLRHEIGALVSRRWVRAYVTPQTLPAASTVIVTAKESAGGLVRAQVRFNTAGTLTLRNVTVAVATGTAVVQAGQMFRYEWALDETAGQQRLRIFIGPNIHGTTPDEEITGPLSVGTFDRLEIGHVSAGIWTTWLDDAGTSDTDWLGPTDTPATPAGTVTPGVGLPVFTTPGAAPPPVTGSELDSLHRPPAGKIIWGCTPGRLGDNTVNPTTLADLEQRTGRRMDAIRLFGANCSSSVFHSTSNEKIMGTGDANGGRLIVISIRSAPFTNDQVIAGAADTTLAARASEIAAYGRPVILIFNHEPEGPNGEDMPAATFNALQKKVLPFFRSRCPNLRTAVCYMGGANITYVRNSFPPTDAAMAAAVDWIMFDPYTFRDGGAAPRQMSAIINTYMTWAEEGLLVDKPVAFAEWGCADDPYGRDPVTDPITDAGRGKGAFFDETGAWFRDTPRGRRVQLSLYFSHPGTTPFQPVESTFTGYTATSPTRTADATLNSLEGWKRISSKTLFPRTDVRLGF